MVIRKVALGFVFQEIAILRTCSSASPLCPIESFWLDRLILLWFPGSLHTNLPGGGKLVLYRNRVFTCLRVGVNQTFLDTVPRKTDPMERPDSDRYMPKPFLTTWRIWHIPLWLSCPITIGLLLGNSDGDALSWVAFSLTIWVIFLYNLPINFQRNFRVGF